LENRLVSTVPLERRLFDAFQNPITNLCGSGPKERKRDYEEDERGDGGR
jgi:hypothetical protein